MKAFIFMIVLSLYAFANIGTIMALKGLVTIERGATIDAKMGMNIEQGDKIVTQTNSQVQVMLKDETVVTIGANSSFDFQTFSFDGSKNSKIDLKANRGFFRTVTGKIAKVAPNRFKVKTVSATIGIRGTDFSGNIDLERDMEVIRCYSGKIFVELDKGGVQDIDAGMLIEISNKNIELKSVVEEMPIKKVIYQSKITPEKISEVNNQIVKPKIHEVQPYPDHTPDYIPNFHEEYKY
ncbi:MAG: FecR domain-containing protein [Campylobacterales bacterium]|nr:FecR domain-containing protein [Campylobacterales bacterium]